VPIVDVEWVAHERETAPPAQSLADAVGRTLAAAPGRVWVRLRRLPVSDYAENGCSVGDGESPVFVSVQHAHPPQGDERDAEMVALTRAVADVFARDVSRVHVRYAAGGAGRQAFGGRWVA
jgi:hypothetical protein